MQGTVEVLSPSTGGLFDIVISIFVNTEWKTCWPGSVGTTRVTGRTMWDALSTVLLSW